MPIMFPLTLHIKGLCTLPYTIMLSYSSNFSHFLFIFLHSLKISHIYNKALSWVYIGRVHALEYSVLTLRLVLVNSDKARPAAGFYLRAAVNLRGKKKKKENIRSLGQHTQYSDSRRVDLFCQKKKKRKSLTRR